MIKWPLILFMLSPLNGILASEVPPGLKCNPTANESEMWNFSIVSYRNESGRWITASTTREWSENSTNSTVNVVETIFECAGRKMLRLQGTFKVPLANYESDDRLRFHTITGPNTALINKGYTVVKLKTDQNGVVLTHRPLRTGELFEVRMDKRLPGQGSANGIGITTRTPYNGTLPDHMNNLKDGTWLLYGNNLWMNNKNVLPEYSSINIYTLTPGERMGVMKSDTGALHFFVNGVDQGPAASNIPEGVYGVYELYGKVTQATIVHQP